MQGYYKAPELTRDVFTEDGWFKTGDRGMFDKKSRIYRLAKLLQRAGGYYRPPKQDQWGTAHGGRRYA